MHNNRFNPLPADFQKRIYQNYAGFLFVFKACPVLDPGIIITGDTDTSVLQNIQKEGLLMLSKPVTPKELESKMGLLTNS